VTFVEAGVKTTCGTATADVASVIPVPLPAGRLIAAVAESLQRLEALYRLAAGGY